MSASARWIEILAERFGLSGYSVVTGLGDNDRSATGFLNEEFQQRATLCSAAHQRARRETAAQGKPWAAVYV